jgi:tetratricopeptide (TPR) repeat protein
VRFREALEVPPEMTQEGVAGAAWVELRHVSQYLRPLLAEELLRERTSHVKGIRQRRRVYDLTDSGQHSAYRLRDRVKAEVVSVQDERGVREETIAEALESLGGAVSLLELVRRSMKQGRVDLTALGRAPESPRVEMIAEAPRLDRFVGRKAELEAIVAEDGGPRIFVIRGVAGIGKSSIAAKACELLHGRRNLFWHTLRAWDTRISVLAALGTFLASIGKPGLRAVVARGDAGQAAAVLREDLPGSAAFLIFDDAHEAGVEVLALFRFLKDAVAAAADVRALVLTRRSLAFYDRRDVSLSGVVREIDLAGLTAEDIAAFLSPDLELAVGNLGQRLGGHPLFLQLVRSTPHLPIHGGALRNMHRFLEEEIYVDLSDPERRALKTASLYRVPVPWQALHSDPSVTHDVVLSLTNRSLLRGVGPDALEVHDTIRSFFGEILTPSEAGALGQFAAAQLRQLASRAHAAGEFGACIDYLSNALRLPVEGEDRVALLESLGDENDKIGDFPATLTAYKEAMRASGAPEIQARLHRKTAAALEARGEVKAAARELEAARQLLGDNVTVERGWVDLIQSRVASRLEDSERAREAAQSALDVFETFHERSAVVRTLYELGYVEMDSHPGNLRAAERYLLNGLDVAVALGDRELTAKVHTGLANLYAGRLGDVDRGLEHIAAVEADPQVLQDPQVLRSFRMLQGWFQLDIRADFLAAERSFAEAADLARKLHYAPSVTFSQFGIALSHYYQGQVREARQEFERYGSDILAQGFPAFAVEALLLVAECDLRLGDLAGFNRVAEEIRRPELAEGRRARPVRVKVLQAIRCFLDDDLEGARNAFDAALRLAGSGDVIEEALLLHIVHFYCGIALRVCGNREEGEQHLREAREFLEKYHLKARLSILPDAERELAETLARGLRSNDRG